MIGLAVTLTITHLSAYVGYRMGRRYVEARADRGEGRT